MNNRPGRISNLDIFRGICALVVFIYHLVAHVRYTAFMPQGSWQAAIYEFAWSMLQPLSTFAVIGFFLLSGFVITLYVRHDIAKEGKYLEFLIFRLTRFSFVCAPAVLVTVVLAYVYQTAYPNSVWSQYQNYNPVGIAASAAGLSRDWNWPGWTLVVEWSFYITVSLFGSLCRPTTLNLSIAVGCITYLFFTNALQQYPMLTLSFFLGAMLTSIKESVSDKGKTLAAAGTLILIAELSSPSLTTSYDDALIKCIPMAMFLLAFSAFPAWTGRLAGVLHWLGKISFSLYIWHWPVIIFGNWYIFGDPSVASYCDMILIFVVYPPVVLVISHWSYLVFERNYKIPAVKKLLTKEEWMAWRNLY